MGLLTPLKKYLHKRELSQKLKQASRNQQVTNLRDSEFIGIIFDANDRANNKLINDYSEKLKYAGKKVSLLGYYEGSKEPTDLYFPYFYAKNINWKLQPTGEAVDSFLEREYDILMNFNLSANLYITYIVAISQARFKVGMFADHHNEYHDMMMKMDKKLSLESLIDQTHYYLNHINK